MTLEAIIIFLSGISVKGMQRYSINVRPKHLISLKSEYILE